MVAVVTQFHSTPLSEVLKMPSAEILRWHNSAVDLQNKISKLQNGG